MVYVYGAQNASGYIIRAYPSSISSSSESGGMVLVAYAGPVRTLVALRDNVLCLPTDIHSLLVNKPSSEGSK